MAEVKHIVRTAHDLKKAAWHLQRAIERAEGKHQDGIR